MINDPYELNNLIDVPEYADIYKQMSMKMLKWYQETCDIVPFKEDDRFNMHYLVERIKCRVSPAEAEEVQKRLDEGTLTNNDILTILARSSGNEENLAEIEEA
jgi:hypothetical protein